MPSWTLTYDGTTKTLAAWGITDAVVFWGNQVRDTLTLARDGQSFDTAPTFAEGSELVLTSPDAVIMFRGRVLTVEPAASGLREAVIYHAAGVWDKFEQTPFGQMWKERDGDFRIQSDVFLPGRIAEGNDFEYIHTGDMILEVIAFLNARLGAVVQAGTISPDLQIPLDQKTDLRCSQVVQLMLGLSPDVVVRFNYTTNPPTMDVLKRADMAPKYIALSAERITEIRPRKRMDLVPSRVAIIYKQVNTDDGVSRTFTTRDIWPLPGEDDDGLAGFEYGALCQTVNLFGANITRVHGYVESEEIPAEPDAQWFTDRGLSVHDISNFQFVSRNGEQLYELLDGIVLPWMLDGEAFVESDDFVCSYTDTVVNGEATKKVEDLKRGQVTINTTNVPTGPYDVISSIEYAEPIPVGLAQKVFESLSTAFWEADIELTDEECSGEILPGDLLNITGGTGRFAEMNAVVQAVRMNIVTGQTTISIGPPSQLRIEQLIDMLRFNRTRRVYLNTKVQTDGEMANGDVDLDGSVPSRSANSAPGEPVMNQWGASEGEYVKIDVRPTKAAGDPIMTAMVQSADGQLRQVTLREITVRVLGADNVCVNRKRIVMCSDLF